MLYYNLLLLRIAYYFSSVEAPPLADRYTEETAAAYREFYLCGSPSMVKDARARLEALGVPKSAIFFEQY